MVLGVPDPEYRDGPSPESRSHCGSVAVNCIHVKSAHTDFKTLSKINAITKIMRLLTLNC